MFGVAAVLVAFGQHTAVLDDQQPGRRVGGEALIDACPVERLVGRG